MCCKLGQLIHRSIKLLLMLYRKHLLMHDPWTYHQCCLQKSQGISGLTTDTFVLVNQPRLIRPGLCPSGIILPPLLSPLQPEPSGNFFCCLHVVAYGSSSVSTCYVQHAVGLAQGVTGKSPAAHLYWHTPGPPSVPPTILHQFLVFFPLSLLSLHHPLLPGHCQLQQDQLFCGLRDQDDVRSQFRLGGVCWNFQLPFQVNCHSQSRAVESKPTEQFFDAFSGFCPSLMKWMVLAVVWVCQLSLIPLLIASAVDLRTWSCLHRYPPSPSALEQLLRMCSNVPTL